jgi:hypothetical protein
MLRLDSIEVESKWWWWRRVTWCGREACAVIGEEHTRARRRRLGEADDVKSSAGMFRRIEFGCGRKDGLN